MNSLTPNKESLRASLDRLSPERRALLAARLKARPKAADPPEPARQLPITALEHGPERPLSYAQRRLWFLDRFEPGKPTYNILAPVHITGALNVAALRRAIHEVVRRHETLRTRFEERAGAPVQVVSPDAGVRLAVVDLRLIEEAEREMEGRRLAIEEARRPFDLAAGPLLRATLLRLGEDEHALLLTMHHIVSDGWSMGVLIRELVTLYTAFREGLPSPLAEPEIQYGDYVRWQQERMEEGQLDEQLAYWRGRLAGAPTSLDLPTDYPAPPVQSFNGARRTMQLSAGLTAALKRLGREHGVSLFMILLAVYDVLLHRYAHQDDILVGTPIANRNRRELEGLIGFFANTLVLRADLSDDPTFAELLARVRRGALDAFAHQDLPFERLVEEINPARDSSRQPLFQVMFVFQNTPSAALAAPGLDIKPFGVEPRTAKFHLTLTMEEAGGVINGSLEYNTDLFAADTVARMLAHFESLVACAVADPQRRVSQLDLLTADERRRMLVEWNPADRPAPALGAHQLFEAQAARTPDRPAAVFADRQITYAELNAGANRLARELIERGVGPETPVAICMERSLDMPAAVLGVLKAGGCYVPLDPGYPPERLAYMLADSGARLVLTDEATAFAPEAFDGELIRVDQADLSRHSGDDPGPRAAAGHPAYLIYTSGSTGLPKGVAMTHGALVNLVEWTCGELGLRPGARTLQLSPLSFDASFNEMFTTWHGGGTLVMVPDHVRRDPDGLLRLLIEAGVERLFPPYAALQQMADLISPAQAAALRLRDVLSTAEQLQITPSVARLFAALPDCRLHNQYGPSETHVVTHHTLEGAADQWRALPPIGRPIAGARAYLLDRHLQPVPVGVPGELYLGGACLSRGYHRRPELTAERFIPDPFAARPGERMYRTGDLARYLPSGEIDYLGRVDQQVKIRGYRIEAGEVEARLAEHPGVREAVVAARGRTAADKRLVAYVVAEPSAPPGAADLQAHLRGRLPEFMIPADYVFLERLPLTPSGKVARRALPEPRADRSAMAAAYVAPRNAAERVVAGVWAAILRRDQVGVRDNFFDLGGHSLLVTQVVARLRDLFQIELPVRSLFEGPTVERLVEQLNRQWGDAALVEEIAHTVEEIDRLSTDEVSHMLAGARGESAPA